MQYKVIHIIWALNSGGAENMLVDIVNEQCKTENVGLIIINNLYDLSIFKRIDKRVKVWMIKRKPSGINPLPILKLNLFLLKLDYFCLHCHNNELIKLIKLNKKPVYLTLHCNGINSNVLSKYSILFAISDAVRKDVLTRSAIDSIVIYNGIKTSELKEMPNVNDNEIRIIQVSRLEHYEKGQHILLKALHILKQKNKLGNIKCHFIGEGSSYDYLCELVKEYKLEDSVLFLGLKNREYVYDNLCNYNLLVQPSINEGFGLTVAEGMAAKVPVLISENEGPLEIIENGKYGFSFKKENAEDCAVKIEEIISMKDSEISYLKEKAFIRVKETFDIRETANKYLLNY